MYQAKNVPNRVCVVQVVTMHFFAIINSAVYLVFTEKKTCNIHNEQNIRAENKQNLYRQNNMVSGMQHYSLYYLVRMIKCRKNAIIVLHPTQLSIERARSNVLAMNAKRWVYQQNIRFKKKIP